MKALNGGTGTRSVKQAIRIAAPSECVYAALTRPEEITRWLSRTAVWSDKSRGVLRFGWGSLEFEVVYLERKPHRRVVLKWGYGHGVGDRVTFTLEPSGEGTMVTLVHDGFETGADALDEWAGAHEGWSFYLCNLLCHLEFVRDLRQGQPEGTIAG